MREGVAVDAFGVEAGCARFGLKGSGVVPAGGAGFLFGGGLFEEDAEGLGARAKGGRDARREAVSAG